MPTSPEGTASALRRPGRLVARSPAMCAVLEALERLARTDVTVTLVGETGAGKDVLAHALHERSSRSRGPLVVFDCGAVAAQLAESELFGHERGSFTGATSTHEGAFERAQSGTLFLDEVGDLPLALQTRLLRALESRCIRRVGGKVDRPIDVRIVAATNRHLRADVAVGRFREDLFFRLAVALVEVPSLRERLEDLPDLIQTLLSDLGRPDLRLSEAALSAMLAHPWRGNVRELKNALICVGAFAERGAVIEPHQLHVLGLSGAEERLPSFVDDLALGGHSLEHLEKAAVRQTLQRARGSAEVAARSLGIDVSTLYQKMKKYGLRAG